MGGGCAQAAMEAADIALMTDDLVMIAAAPAVSCTWPRAASVLDLESVVQLARRITKCAVSLHGDAAQSGQLLEFVPEKSWVVQPLAHLRRNNPL